MPVGNAGPTGPKIGSQPPVGLQVRTKVVTDVQTRTFTAIEGVPAPGAAGLSLPVVPSGYGFQIERLDLQCPSGLQTPVVQAFIGPPIAANEIDFSIEGLHDVGDFNQPIYVPSGSTFQLLWTGLAAGSGVLVTARVQWSIVQFVAVTYQ